MLEMRIFEMSRHDAPVSWTVKRTQRLTLISGSLWVTIEGELEHIWLKENQSLELKPNVKFRISTGVDGGRFTVWEAHRGFAEFATFTRD